MPARRLRRSSKRNKHSRLRPAKPRAENIRADHFEVAEVARQHTIKAIETLRSITENGAKCADRIAAARALLDYGHGRPAAQVNIKPATQVTQVFRTEAEFRAALLERGVHPNLLPAALKSATASDTRAPETDAPPKEK